MQKSLLSLFLILSCGLLATHPVLAKRQVELEQKMAEQLNKPVDYTDLPNLKLTFEFAMVACLNAEDTLAQEKANELFKDLNGHWKAAYEVVQKHSSKKRLRKRKAW